MSNELEARCCALKENYEEISEKIARAAEQSGRRPEDITLLAATKTVPVEVINYGIQLGITTIGENRVQEFLSKEEDLLPSVRHLIGHLQTNKVKQIVGRVSMIQSVDSERLAAEISRLSQQKGIQTEILVEVNIGREENKSGIFAEELDSFLEKIDLLPGIRVCGLMTIPPICEKESEIREYFSKMHKLFIDRQGKKMHNGNMAVLSMGMSGDYEQAILEGATMVRIGSALFGARKYK